MADTTKQEQIDLLQDIQGILPCNPNLQGQPELLDKMLNAIDAGAAALQAAVPRVLSKSEAKEFAENHTHIWTEYKRRGAFPDLSAAKDDKFWIGYGKCWRWWTGAKPPADQMAATPWDKQEG